MSSDLLSIARSGLEASKIKLAVTGHNIANVDTPGYSRQETTQRAMYAGRESQFSARTAYMGTGTTLLDVRRVYSDFMTSQLRTTTSLNSDAASYQTQIESLDSLLAGSTTSLSSSMQGFFSALQTVADDPANAASRQLVLTDAEGTAKRFNNLYSTLSDQRELVNTEIGSVTDQINQLATSIGQMNGTIAEAVANGSQPNDLMDARDEAIRELSTYVGVNVVKQDASTLNVFVGSSGSPLVVGEQVNRLEASSSTDDPTQVGVYFVSDSRNQEVTSLLTGGQLGGLIRYREDSLNPTLNTLGQMALVLTETVNKQLGQGLDLNGNAGAALFGDINTSAMMSERVVVSSDNISEADGELKITDAGKLTTSDYKLTYDGSNYSAQRLSDGASITVSTAPSGELTFADAQGRDQGFTMTISGTPEAGDSFQLQPTKRGAADISAVLKQPSLLALAAPLKSGAGLQNKGSGALTQPTISSITDNSVPPQDAAMLPDDLKAVSPMTWAYDSASGNLSATLPSLPAGYTATVTPATLATTAGQSNALEYTLEVNNGTSTTLYTVKQTFSGAPQDGDTFNLAFNAGGVSDNRNALALAALQSSKVVGEDSTSSASLSDTYGSMVEKVGTLTAQARQDTATTGALLTYATDSRDSLSGVNLDEEAANLIKYQQQYDAAAQVIQVSRSLFDTLLSALR